MATVFLNGKLLSRDEAMVSAFDAGFQHGVGLFETMLGVEGEGVFRLDDHIERLTDSARGLGLSGDLRAPALADVVQRTFEASGLARARIRLTVTGGDLNLLGRGDGGKVQPTILIVAQPATEYPPGMFSTGVAATIADFRANPLDPHAGHKTLNYWGRLRELQSAAARQAGEALVLQVTNHLAGGCVSNAFLVKNGSLVTPIARGEETGVPSPVLPGIVRGFITEWAGGRGITVHRRMVSIADVLEADELFLTNSSWGVLPVVRVEKERIAGGQVGPLTVDARRAWLDSVGEAM